MKRTIAFIAVIALCQTLAFGQKKYEMVVETTDGNSVTFPTEFIKRIYFRESNTCPDNNHPHMIDLGLPSGTKWACCNVGASKPEDYGNYYAWGETQTKDSYEWRTYIHCDGSYETCHDIGFDISGTQYDAATANWGAPWRLPTQAQCEELINKCTSVWATENGVDGRRFTGPNGRSLFFPATGYRSRYDLEGVEIGCYWSSTLSEWQPYCAYILFFDSERVDTPDDKYRMDGQPVRPVRKN